LNANDTLGPASVQSESADAEFHQSLNWFLCWAVVYAPVGTSLFYAPGVIFGDARSLTGLCLLLSSLTFVFLVAKYVDVAARYSEGGGVVAVATHAFGSLAGLFGGALVTVSYFLTAAVSAVTGFAFLNSAVPITHYLVPLSVTAIALLGVLNYIGIKESAMVTAAFGSVCFATQLLVTAVVATQVKPSGWHLIFNHIAHPNNVQLSVLIAGYASSFLAFSGLESISQLSPAMVLPRRRTAGIAMTVVVITTLATIPIVTVFATNLITARSQGADETILTTIERVPERERLLNRTADPAERAQLSAQIDEGNGYSASLVSYLGAQFGGTPLKLSIVFSATTLLVLACSTAIIGAYHVFMALARQSFLPKALLRRNDRFGTPHWAIALATVPPILIVIAARGDMTFLGQLFAYGLLGGFMLTAVSLDVVRWKERRFGAVFVIGILTTAAVVIAWLGNLYSKPFATLTGGLLTLTIIVVALEVRRRSRRAAVALPGLVTDVTRVPRGAVLVPVFDEHFQATEHEMFEFVGALASQRNLPVIILYIREFFDVLQVVPEELGDDPSAEAFVRAAERVLEEAGVKVFVVYIAASDVADVVGKFRRRFRPSLTVLSRHRHSGLVTALHGNPVSTIRAAEEDGLLIYPDTQDAASLHRFPRDRASDALPRN
jgi:amino acid transporter